jgi:uncharacterized protein
MNQGFSISKLNLLLVMILSLASIQCLSQTTQPFSLNESPLPAPTSPIMDYAGVLDAATKQALEKRVIEFRDRTNPRVELAVAIVKTTGERPIFDYSLAVARGWKIGSKEDDNPSALLFIAIDDRKYFTQISKDLEDELPDGLAGQLQRQYLVPAFRQGNYGKGVTDIIEAYIRTIEARQSGAPVTGTTGNQNGKIVGARDRRSQESGGFCSTMVCLIILFVFLISIFSRLGSGPRGGRNYRRRSGWRGGGFGGSAVPWIVGSIIANSINSGGSSGGWGGGSSGGWGGSSGGGGWGGFGGGGDFGGGGAGGGW